MERYTDVSQFFRELKDSPLAKESTEAEEAAIWLDVNGLSNAKGIWKIIYECINAYHTRHDWNAKDSILQCHGTYSMLLFDGYSTDIIFKNLFILLFNTSHLDACCLSNAFIKKVHRECVKHKKKIKYVDKGRGGAIFANEVESSLHEILAELEERLTKKAVSLQA